MFEEQLSEDTRNILGLQLPTDPRWVDLAGKSMEDILTKRKDRKRAFPDRY